MALGHGGIRRVARAAHVAEKTVARGVSELAGDRPQMDRTRQRGGGRKRLVELDPGLWPALQALLGTARSSTAEAPIQWTTKSTRKLAEELARQSWHISADTVADILRAQGFRLRRNYTTIDDGRDPDRHAQFNYLTEQIIAHQMTGSPVLNVEISTSQMVKQPLDRSQPADYGNVDEASENSWTTVRNDANTAAFAVATIRHWWHSMGASAYPQGSRVLITADAFGSDAPRTQTWKAELTALATETYLDITFCHLPPATTKWSRLIAQLACQVMIHPSREPPTRHQVTIGTIESLSNHARSRTPADESLSLAPVRARDAEPLTLPVTPHDFRGEWNYTLHPNALHHSGKPCSCSDTA